MVLMKMKYFELICLALEASSCRKVSVLNVAICATLGRTGYLVPSQPFISHAFEIFYHKQFSILNQLCAKLVILWENSRAI